MASHSHESLSGLTETSVQLHLQSSGPPSCPGRTESGRTETDWALHQEVQEAREALEAPEARLENPPAHSG